MARFILLCVCGWVFTSCSTENKSDDDSIAGIYVREYSTEILNQLSGAKVGMRTFRDTIKISESGQGYHVANTKWRMNDYDQEGWRNMKYGENRPLPEFDASYDERSGMLMPELSGVVPSLHIEQGKLSVGNRSKIVYAKIN